jgi:hypothetical protein
LSASLGVLQMWTLPDVGNSVKDDSSDITCAFPIVWCPVFMVVTPSFTHLSIAFSNQKVSNCSPIMDVRFVKFRSDNFCGNRVFKVNIQFCCPVTYAAVVLWFLETVLLNIRSLSPIVPLRWCCLPMIRVCLHNLRNCRSRYTWYRYTW